MQFAKTFFYYIDKKLKFAHMDYSPGIILGIVYELFHLSCKLNLWNWYVKFYFSMNTQYWDWRVWGVQGESDLAVGVDFQSSCHKPRCVLPPPWSASLCYVKLFCIYFMNMFWNYYFFSLGGRVIGSGSRVIDSMEWVGKPNMKRKDFSWSQ